MIRFIEEHLAFIMCWKNLHNLSMCSAAVWSLISPSKC